MIFTTYSIDTYLAVSLLSHLMLSLSAYTDALTSIIG